jgi:hypothetical protein
MEESLSGASTDRRTFLQALGGSGLTAGAFANGTAARSSTRDCSAVRLEADKTELEVGDFSIFTVHADDGCTIEDFELVFTTPRGTVTPEAVSLEDSERKQAARRFGSAGTFAAFAEVTVEGRRVLTNTVLIEVTGDGGLTVENAALSVASDRRAAVGNVTVANEGSAAKVVEVALFEDEPNEGNPLDSKTAIIAGGDTQSAQVSAFTEHEFDDLFVTVNGSVEAREAGGRFEVRKLYAPESIERGEELTVYAKIKNVGRREGRRTVTYRFDGEDVDSREGSLDAGESTFVAFEFTPDVEPGTYTHSVTTGDDTKSTDIDVAGDAIAINFQPEDAYVPDDFIPDTGERFDDRNGLRYGWSEEHTDTTRDRDDHDLSQELNTLNHFVQDNGTTERPYDSRTDPEWEIELDDGTYDVTLVGGDADHLDNELSFAVNDTLFIDNEFDNQELRRPRGKNFIKHEGTVEVTDGTLTIAPPDGAFNPKICWLEIRSQ